MQPQTAGYFWKPLAHIHHESNAEHRVVLLGLELKSRSLIFVRAGKHNGHHFRREVAVSERMTTSGVFEKKDGSPGPTQIPGAHPAAAGPPPEGAHVPNA